MLPCPAVLAPVSQVWSYQRILLSDEKLRKVSDKKKLPCGVLAHVGDTTFLCRPVIRAARGHNFVTVSPAVSLIEGLSTEYASGLGKLATHLEKSGAASSSGRKLERIEPLFSDLGVAEQISVTVVTSKVGSAVRSEELLVALQSVLLVQGAVVHLRGTDVGNLLGVDALFIESASGVVESNVFFVKRGSTQVKISRKICLERLRSLSRYESRRLGGIRRQRAALVTALRRRRTVGLRGVLLSGPPGGGKSSLLEEVAHGEGFLVREAHCADLLRSEGGGTSEEVRRVFQECKRHQEEGDVLLVLDNIEILCPQRESPKIHELQTTSTLFSCLDDLQRSASGIVVVGITTKIQEVDPRLRRHGRLGTEISLGAPDAGEREEILGCLLQGEGESEVAEDEETKGNAKPVNVSEWLARSTPGYVGADLEKLARRLRRDEGMKSEKVSPKVLLAALKEVPSSSFSGGIGAVEVTPVPWDSVVGVEEAKQQLKRAIQWPLERPDLFKVFKVKPSRGCLLYGPPGCGKTKLVRAVASSLNAVFLSASAATIFSPYVGDSEKAVAELFNRARTVAPAVLFIDEVDSLVSARGGGGRSGGVKEKVLATLLNEMDGIGARADGEAGGRREALLELEAGGAEMGRKSRLQMSSSVLDNSKVYVVCATNRPWCLDSALCRPGRLDQLVLVPPPVLEGRREMVRRMTSGAPLSGEVDLEAVADSLPEGASGADVENVCREAAMNALNRGGLDDPSVKVTAADFEKAVKDVKVTLTKEVMQRHLQFAGTSA